jgi:hypothetical protein
MIKIHRISDDDFRCLRYAKIHAQNEFSMIFRIKMQMVQNWRLCPFPKSNGKRAFSSIFFDSS